MQRAGRNGSGLIIAGMNSMPRFVRKKIRAADAMTIGNTG